MLHKTLVPVTFAVIGMGLMALTFAWNVNPVEGSVMPHFLTDSVPGLVLLWVLLVTCMPVWILTGMAGEAQVGGSDIVLPGMTVEVVTMLIQGIVYFLIGIVVQALEQRIDGRWIATNG